jgi:hypothetical protein
MRASGSQLHLVNGLMARRNAIRRRGLPGLVIAQRVTRSIRVEESAVDREGRLHTFGRSRNDELHAAAGIPSGIDAGNVRCGVFPAPNTIGILAKFAAKLFRQMRALILPR